jgi:FkbM family methyltransferase
MSDSIWSEKGLLGRYRCTDALRGVRSIAQGGAHLGQEIPRFQALFPDLERLYLFEPIPELAAHLRRLAGLVKRLEIHVFEMAICGREGTSTFEVMGHETDHLGRSTESSSLTPLADAARKYYGHNITRERQIVVRTGLVEQEIERAYLPRPEVLYVDVHGAELAVVQSLSPSFRRGLKMILAECGIVQYFVGGPVLDDMREYLEPEFEFVEFIEHFQARVGDALWRNTSCR